MLEFKFSGKTINQAIQNGIEKLGVNKNDVEIKILMPPQNFQDAVVLVCVPKVFATQGIYNFYELQNLNNQIAKTQQTVQKRKKEKNSILKKLLTEVVIDAETQNLAETEVATKLLDYILKLCGCSDAKITVTEDAQHINLQANHPNLDELIGFKGKTLAEIQKFLNEQLKKQKTEKRAVLDFNGFKEKETKKLQALAKKIVQKVRETGVDEQLKPMNAFQRRVVHNVVAQTPDVASESIGTPPKRCVIIKKVQKED